VKPRRLGLALLTAVAASTLIPAHLWGVQPAAPPACETPTDRAFDFWIGSWAVIDNSDGTPAGENVIEVISNCCALLENWTSVAGNSGKSINYYDPADGLWHQTWVGAGRSILNLSGSFENGVMDLRGTSTNRAGVQVLNRIRWFDEADGSVRQWWQVSSDGGDTWWTAFDGTYVKKP
jgi:hypothetical protein